MDLVVTSDENTIENVSVGEHFNTSNIIRLSLVIQRLVMELTQEVNTYVKRPNFHKLKEETKNGLGCENAARPENFKNKYVNRRIICILQ